MNETDRIYKEVMEEQFSKIDERYKFTDLRKQQNKTKQKTLDNYSNP
jgi:hypothetical protein